MADDPVTTDTPTPVPEVTPPLGYVGIVRASDLPLIQMLNVEAIVSFHGATHNDVPVVNIRVDTRENTTSRSFRSYDTLADFARRVDQAREALRASHSAGWTPVLAVVLDGDRRVVKITDWIGGSEPKPEADRYIGQAGFVEVLADATDIRGPAAAATPPTT